MSIGQKAVNTSKCCSLEGKGFTQSITYDKTRPRRTLEILNGRPLLISEYTYDNMGRIASETAGGCTTTYTCDEYSQLIEEENEALDKTFQYEYNEVGNTVYLDDAWGNCTIDGTTTNYDLAHANPIRYRGYYYDEDTKLYYLNARYYSPEFRRFISLDDTNYLVPKNVNGLNLYCYCNNDPVLFVDYNGTFAYTMWTGDKPYDPSDDWWISVSGAGGGGGAYGGASTYGSGTYEHNPAQNRTPNAIGGYAVYLDYPDYKDYPIYLVYLNLKKLREFSLWKWIVNSHNDFFEFAQEEASTEGVAQSVQSMLNHVYSRGGGGGPMCGSWNSFIDRMFDEFGYASLE